jgi:single-strand DNA-binding protein
MAGNFNKVMLMGNLTRDPELRYTPNNTAVCKIGVAVNRRWRDQQGEMREEVTFVDCDAFGKTAETINQYLKKGQPIFIEGRLRLDQWQDKEGNKRSKLGVVIENFQFIGARDGGGGGPAGGPSPASRSAPRSAAAAAAPAAESGFDPVHEPVGEDDIPF